MLYYSQIKREFAQNTWKKGQTNFHKNFVAEVRMSGENVSGKIKDSDNPSNINTYDTTIVMSHGTIKRSRCSCAYHGTNEHDMHCQHVAALGIWIIERGSLLRAGIDSTNLGMAKENAGENESAKSTKSPKQPQYRGEGVAFVRGVFEKKALVAVVIEPALRWLGMPTAKKTGVKTVNVCPQRFLRKHFEPGIWQTAEGVLLKPDPNTVYNIPFIQSLEAEKLTYQGKDTLEILSKILASDQKARIFMDEHLEMKPDPDPLKLISFNIGAKTGKHRILSYEFRNSTLRLTSEELAKLSALGRLSNRYVWKGDRLYRFDPPLALLARYANRSGIAPSDDPDNPEPLKGFDLLADDEEHPLHPLTVYRLVLELGVNNYVIDKDWKEFHAWRKNFERKKLPPLPKVKYGFKLRNYQKNGLSWLWSLYHRGLAALLADDMGLGKTHQALALLSSLYLDEKNKPDHPSIVIAPTSVIAAWSQKLAKYDTGLKWYVFHGKSREMPGDDINVVLTTYGILQREAALREREWEVIILDEAQAIKNASTISSRASRVLKSIFRIAMTGTPIENQATDLWSLTEYLIPGYLGTIARFKRLYGCGYDGTSGYQAATLKRLLSPFLLRRTKSQVLKELPEKTEEIVQCNMTAEQARTYEEYLSSAEAEKARHNLETGGKIDYVGILALLTRLKQVCDHPRLPGLGAGVQLPKKIDPLQSGKWEHFMELLEEALRSNLKVVVFTQYLGMMDLMNRTLKEKGIGHTDLRGDTSDRQGRIELFGNDPECKVFLCSLLAGGLGIDLTAGSVCIHFDRWWNPARENQATDRLHRIGQTRGVQVFKLQIPGTIEDRIARIIESKKTLSGALIEESPVGLKSFSREELLELLKPLPRNTT